MAFWNDSSEIFHRLWMGTLRWGTWVTPRDRQLCHPKTFIFTETMSPTGRNRAAAAGRAEVSPATLPTGNAAKWPADRPVSATKFVTIGLATMGRVCAKT
jgi:hypothetical protein